MPPIVDATFLSSKWYFPPDVKGYYSFLFFLLSRKEHDKYSVSLSIDPEKDDGKRPKTVEQGKGTGKLFVPSLHATFITDNLSPASLKNKDVI